MDEFEKACAEVDGDSLGLTTQENVIEFMRNAKVATVTFCQPRYVTKVEKLAKDHPDEVQIVYRNKDGSIVAHVPVSYVKVSRPRELTEEQKQKAGERLKQMRNNSLVSDESPR